MTTEKKTAPPRTTAPLRSVLMVCGAVLLALSVTFWLTLTTALGALDRPATWEAVADAAGFSEEEIAAQITVEWLMQRLPAVALEAIGDPARFLTESQKAELNRLLKETVAASRKDALAQIPGYVKSQARPIEVSVTLTPIREGLIRQIKQKLGPLVAMVVGSLLEEGVKAAIPDRLVLPEASQSLMNALAPLCSHLPFLQNARIAAIALAVFALILILLSGGGGLRFPMAFAGSVALSGLFVIIVSRGAWTTVLSKLVPTPGASLTALAEIVATDLFLPGTILLIFGVVTALIALGIGGWISRSRRTGYRSRTSQ